MMSVLRWNIVWAVVSTITAFVAGFGVALLMNREDIRFRAFFRTAFILPWAMPSFISALVWTGLFNTTFGPINEVLGMLGVSPDSLAEQCHVGSDRAVCCEYLDGLSLPDGAVPRDPAGDSQRTI